MEEKSLDTKTMIISGVILFLSFIFCYIPIYLSSFKNVKKYFQYISATAAGLLLAILLIDIGPHVVKGPCCFHNHSHDHKGHGDHHHHGDHSHNTFKYEYHGLITSGIVFILLLAIDTLFLHHEQCETNIRNDQKNSCKKEESHCHDEIFNESPESMGFCNTSSIKNSKSPLQAMIFVAAISVHSFLEGLAIRRGHKGVSWYEIALIVHKILESIGLSISIQQSKFNKSVVLVLFSLFSISTPLAMMLSTLLDPKSLTFSLANGGAMGSVLFIVFVEMIPSLFHGHSSKNSAKKLICFFIGFSITAFFVVMTHSNLTQKN